MIGGRSRSARHLHFAPKRKRRPWLKIALAVLVVLVLLACAGVVKAATASTPDLTVHRALPASVRLPGTPPKPAWPSQGEAAVEVEGLPPLGSSGPSTPVPIASLAKIMTAYVILGDHPLKAGAGGFTITVSAAAVSDYNQRLAQAQSVVAVAAGEQIDELQLLQGLLVGSGNNYASLLATYDSGSVPAFVARMQSTAARLGMTHTTYTDPSGLAPSTVSTAADQLLLSARAMANPVFAQIVGQTSVNLPVAGQVPNFDTSVGQGGYIGVKTGSDSTSGGCLVFANRQESGNQPFTILGVVLGQSPGLNSTPALIAAAVRSADAIVNSVKPAVSVKTALPAGTEVASVSNAQGRQAPVRTERALTLLGFGGMAVPLSMNVKPVGTKLDDGAPVASVSISGGGSTPANAAAAVPPASFGWKLRHDY